MGLMTSRFTLPKYACTRPPRRRRNATNHPRPWSAHPCMPRVDQDAGLICRPGSRATELERIGPSGGFHICAPVADPLQRNPDGAGHASSRVFRAETRGLEMGCRISASESPRRGTPHAILCFRRAVRRASPVVIRCDDARRSDRSPLCWRAPSASPSRSWTETSSFRGGRSVGSMRKGGVR